MSEKQMNEELSPNRKRAVVFYLLIIFVVAFLLVLVSMFVRMRTMQEDFDSASVDVEESYAQKESELIENASQEVEAYAEQLSQMERRANASELLILAQNAYYEGNTRKFQGCMATLEGYADALSDDALEIYEELVKALRG